MGRDNLCNLSYWFPRLEASGVRVPKTRIIDTDCKLTSLLDGRISRGYTTFIEQLRLVTNAMGYPCFLRTGLTSGKHDWEHTCFLTKSKDLERHVLAIVEYSEETDMLGLPTNEWVVREYIPMESSFTAFHGKFPVNRERRYFIKDGKILCHHTYWPEKAMRNPSVPDWKQKLEALNTDTDEDRERLDELSLLVAQRFDGAWSLDWAKGKDGHWYAIDMAVANRSYHWEGCPQAKLIGDGGFGV